MPFVMVTSRGDKENVVQAIQAGVSGYVSKPLLNEQLLNKVKQALNKIGRSTPCWPARRQDELGFWQRLPQRPDRRQARSGQAGPGGCAEQGLLNSPAVQPTAAPSACSGRGQGQPRLSSGTQQCVIKGLSIEALLVVRRGDVLPQVLESAVLDLEQGESRRNRTPQRLPARHRRLRAAPLTATGCN